MKVIPVAGHDSMLLNIGGAHNAYFTRNIVVLTDNAGHTGIGEAPGGEVILSNTGRCYSDGSGPGSCAPKEVVQQVHKGNQAADLIPSQRHEIFRIGALMPWRRWKPPCLTC